MEFLVEFQVQVPVGTPEAAIDERETAEAAAAVQLASEGHLARARLLAALPLHDWMHVDVRPLAAHPNDPARP